MASPISFSNLPVLGPLATLPLGVIGVAAVVSFLGIMIISDKARNWVADNLAFLVDNPIAQGIWKGVTHMVLPLAYGVVVANFLILPVNYICFLIGMAGLSALPSIEAWYIAVGTITFVKLAIDLNANPRPA